jgi:hypothetical protein
MPDLENGFDYAAKIQLVFAKSYLFVTNFSYFCPKLQLIEPNKLILRQFSIKNTVHWLVRTV